MVVRLGAAANSLEAFLVAATGFKLWYRDGQTYVVAHVTEAETFCPMAVCQHCWLHSAHRAVPVLVTSDMLPPGVPLETCPPCPQCRRPWRVRLARVVRLGRRLRKK